MRIFLIGLPLLFSFGAPCQVKKLDVETTIQNVTVFSSGARVERTAFCEHTGRPCSNFFCWSQQSIRSADGAINGGCWYYVAFCKYKQGFPTERKIEQQEQDFINKTNTLKDKIDLDQKQLDVCKNEEAMLVKKRPLVVSRA